MSTLFAMIDLLWFIFIPGIVLMAIGMKLERETMSLVGAIAAGIGSLPFCLVAVELITEHVVTPPSETVVLFTLMFIAGGCFFEGAFQRNMVMKIVGILLVMVAALHHSNITP